MKKLKKLLTFAGLAVVTFTATAQNFESRSFLNAQSISITNGALGYGITNLNSAISSGTNVYQIVFTNLSGNRVVITNGTSDKFNLLKTIPLTVDRNAAFVGTTLATNANIFIRLGNAGANATNAVTFVFVAVPDYNPLTGIGHESTAAADQWTITTVANTAYPQSFKIGFPYGQFVGCGGLMLKSVSSGAAIAAGSDVFLLECVMDSFVP